MENLKADPWSDDSPLTIVVPIHGQLDSTRRFLDSYERQSERCQLIFVDDHSPDSSVEWLRARGYAVITPTERLFFNGIVNLALDECRSEYLGILNNDLALGQDFVRLSIEAFRGSNWDLLVPHTTNEEGVLGLDQFHPPRLRKLYRQQGWCMLFRHTTIGMLPRIPCEDLKLWYGDTWIFHHAWEEGLKVGEMAHVVVWHEGSVTIKSTASGDWRPKRWNHPVIDADKKNRKEKYRWLDKHKPGLNRILPKWARRLLLAGY